MIAERFSSLLDGYVIIAIRGEYPERFINLSLANEVQLWNIRRRNGYLTAATTIHGFKQLRPIARKCGCVPHIVKKVGLPFFVKRLSQRKALALGMVVGVLAMYVASSFVWFVSVSGVRCMDPRLIERVAISAGVGPGVWKRSIDLDDVRMKIEDGLPELAWVGVRIAGVHATIKVVEKTTADEIPTVTGDIVAAKDGVLTRLVAIRGTRKITENQTVVQGQVLVEGCIYADEKLLKTVRADAIVEAKVWYQGYGQAQIRQKLQERTGLHAYSVALRIGKSEFVYKGVKNSPYACYQLEEKVSPLRWRNITVPVEVVKRDYYELREVERSRTRKHALQEAEVVAQADILSKMPSDAFVLARIVDIIESDDDNTVTVRITIETKEEISKFVPHH